MVGRPRLRLRLHKFFILLYSRIQPFYAVEGVGRQRRRPLKPLNLKTLAKAAEKAFRGEGTRVPLPLCTSPRRRNNIKFNKPLPVSAPRAEELLRSLAVVRLALGVEGRLLNALSRNEHRFIIGDRGNVVVVLAVPRAPWECKCFYCIRKRNAARARAPPPPQSP